MSQGNAGGIYQQGLLVVENSVITANSAAGGGGGLEIYWDNTSATVLSSTIASNSGGGFGGGIVSGGTLTVIASTITGNTGWSGGGIHVRGIDPTTIVNTTISGNRASRNGGAIGTDINPPRIYIAHSTLTGNTADYDGDDDGQGGGLFAFQRAAFIISNTIVAGNQDFGGQSPDCAVVSPSGGGGIYSAGYNLMGDTTGCTMVALSTDLLNQNARLEPLAGNGGDTQTHALRVGSPAADAIPAASCTLSTDQRGESRPLGPGCDIGAYETLTYWSRLPILFRK